MPSDTAPTAALVIIGNEILSGRTVDKNLNFLARELTEMGIRFLEVRVVPDIEAKIINTVNALRAEYDYVFTTGGIGPTHDDITAASIAKAFGRKLICHPEAKARLQGHYPEGQLTDARLRMANTPEGASLIDNSISVAPGFCVENVYVMAGVPSIMQAMFLSLKPQLRQGARIHSKEITVHRPESRIAALMEEVQNRYPNVDIGSYPFGIEEKKYGVHVVLRSVDIAAIEEAAEALNQKLAQLG